MKIINIIIILNLIVLNSCGYKPLNQLYSYNFEIISSKFEGNKQINKNLEKNFIKFENKADATRSFKIETNSELIKKVTSNDSKGKEASYSIEIIVNINVYEKGESVAINSFKKKTDYNNLKSQFELKQYEKVLIKNLTEQIALDLNTYIGTIK